MISHPLKTHRIDWSIKTLRPIIKANHEVSSQEKP